MWSWQRAQATVSAEEGARGRVDLLVDHVQHELAVVLGVVGLAAEGEEAGRDQLVGAAAVVLRRQQIAGDLLADELIVRLVGVEGGDDVVAIAPGLGIGEVGLAARLGEAGHVEPVPPPALAEAGRGEQPVDDRGEGVGRAVREEGVDLLGRGREADQVEVTRRRSVDRSASATGASPRASSAARRKRSISPSGQSACFTGGGSDLFGGRNDQNSFPLRQIDRGARRGGGRPGPGIGRAHLHPRFEVGDDRVGELRLGRHLEIFVAVADRLDQQAFVGVAGHDRRAGVAALAKALAAVEAEPAPQFLGGARVALAALRHQHGPDLRLEELLLLGRDRADCGFSRRGTSAAGVDSFCLEAGRISFEVPGIEVGPPGLCGKDVRYSASERNPS